MYSYLLKKATKKASATKKIADASPMAGFRQLFRRLSGLVSLPLLRQFPFSEPLFGQGERILNSKLFFSFGSVFLLLRAVSRFACHRTPKFLRPGGSVLECARQAVSRATPLSSASPHIQPPRNGVESQNEKKKGRIKMRLP
jgi:hypothetical protein